MVTVISGANEATAQLAGQTVGDVRAAFGTALNIGAAARATINGAAADAGAVLQENDRLVFTRDTAEKGV
jgi:hypothetical protein